MVKTIFSSLFLLLTFTCFAAKHDDSIIVKLETEGRQLPVYLSPTSGKGFTPSYREKIHSVLRYDLANNGTMKLIHTSPDLDALSTDSELTNPANLPTWRALDVFYVVKATLNEDFTMSIKVVVVNGSTMKRIENVSLTGNLSQDRRQIHKLADAIHKTLFGVEGIASRRILYTNKIDFTKDHEVAEVWEADYDGANARQLTHEKALCVTPFYLPPTHGNAPGSFFYVSYAPGVPKIYAASLADGNGQRIVTLRGNQLLPAISRQRDKIAFISDASGNPDLFVASFDPKEGQTEKPRQIFSSSHATQGTPSFSPDGNQVAFVSNKDGRARIYVMDIPEPGTKMRDIKPKLLTKMNRESTSPNWSPDGKKIVYQSRIDKTRQICVYDFYTGDEKQLTTGPGDKENPTWAPNSMHILYNSEGQIYRVNLNNPNPVPVTSGNGEKHFPSWEPR